MYIFVSFIFRVRDEGRHLQLRAASDGQRVRPSGERKGLWFLVYLFIVFCLRAWFLADVT